MRRSPIGLGFILLAVMLVFAMSACQKKTVPFQTADGPGGPGGPGMGGAGMGSDSSRWKDTVLTDEQKRALLADRATQSFLNDDIYFDFDSFTLVDAAKKALDKKAEYLNRHPEVSVVVEGHCDERGTHEYNLALGERRAHSAWQYLVNSGINQKHLSTVSYGQERPLAGGHDESSWAKNRRCHFEIPGLKDTAQ